MNQKISVVWLRRDLRLEDNQAIIKASEFKLPILLLFIFDKNILSELPRDDHRVTFIYEQLQHINMSLSKQDSSIVLRYGTPLEIWKEISQEYDIQNIICARDYEPYAQQRDRTINNWAKEKGINMLGVKDQVIFEKDEILKKDGKPYTVYTPYKNKWLEQYNATYTPSSQSAINFLKCTHSVLSLKDIGFIESPIKAKNYNLDVVSDYHKNRDFPSQEGTSYLSPHLRFGTISVRQLALNSTNSVFLSELIWREFFMQILYHFPHVINQSFKAKYDNIEWRNNEEEFQKWCLGQTGYPLVDAGMRELNQTGYMHNRVRMVTASFLCKHLLIDWRWGETYFAQKLFDFDLSANNGNWQWAAGSGCDAVPYFRVFNPTTQWEKFDKESKYVKKWVPEYLSTSYIKPIVEHSFARQRALDTYKQALE